MTLRGPFDGTPPEAGASPAEGERRRAPRDGAGVTLAGPGAPLIVGAGRLDADFGERYQQRELIARGGMGEVWLCADQRIGRDVAMKAIRGDQGDDAGARARFEREARVQAQLEHPAIVPVYELGLSPEREVFFTMKHVHGKTLAEIIAGLRFEASYEDRPFEAVYSRHRLLTAFNQLCLAIDYAHSRGVIHRDLKPANIMLGSYGEVHVLDWGIAKLAHRGELPPSSRTLTWLDPGSFTHAGEAMGTPGYMAPEQERDAASADERADVYALGAILFELLTLEPVCPRTSGEGEAETWGPADPRASVRAPHREVPPELVAICAKATASRPEDRYPSARKLQEAIERFLEGDRDVQVRKALAERHVQAALETALRAWEPGEQGIAARDRALHELGAALTLDQGNREALDALERLLGEARAAIAPEVHAAIEETEMPVRRTALRGRLGGHAITAAVLLCALAFGVRDARAFAVIALAIAVATGATFVVFLRENVTEAAMRWRALIGALPACAFSLWLGPLLIVPTIAAVNAVMIGAFGAPGHRRVGVAGSVLALAVPYAAQAAGWMEPSYVVRADGLLILPRMTGLPPQYTVGALVLIHVALILIAAFGVSRVRDRMRGMEERMHVQSWKMRHLIPREAYEPVARTSEPPETRSAGSSP